MARRIAARLAENARPNANRFSFRSSVLVAQLISGVIVLGTAAILVFGVYAGAELLVGPPSPDPPEVLSAEVSIAEDRGTTTLASAGAVRLEDFIGVFGVPGTTGAGMTTITARDGAGIGVPMPPGSTTSTSPAAGRSSTSTSNPPQVTSTKPSTTSTSGGSMRTSSTSTSTLPEPTIRTTSTTVTILTTTTVPTTTTMESTTTTLIEETTTTCEKKGKGKGNC